jgi:diguanylate cyclase (GGDEF)-like protein
MNRRFLYSAVLFAVATIALGFAVARHGVFPEGYGAGTAVFFLAYGLFTIFMGYTHPRVGHVSFDRIAQVGCILVLGPVAAAWINGLASLLYPWHRLRDGKPVMEVLGAALHNAGLMTLMILVCGLLYTRLGGAAPLLQVQWGDALRLLVLLLSMQAVNDIAMRVYVAVEERHLPTTISPFAFTVEATAGLGGLLLALVYIKTDLPALVVLLLVLTLGMLALMELARMRIRLEALVAERTRELHDKTLELQRIATHDPLTGLHNRRYADDYLEERMGEFERYRRRFAIALVDLDDFKRINDEFSHDTGDEVLKAVARILAERCRDTDMVARYGGEEFLLCFPQADEAAALEACEKIRAAVAQGGWDALVPDFRVTLSAGVAIMRTGLSRRELLGAADRALYAAKLSGRNKVCVALETADSDQR